MKQVIILLLFWSICSLLSAQSIPSDLQRKIIMGINNYRSEAFYDTKDQLKEIKQLLYKLDSLEIPRYEQEQFILDIGYSINFNYSNPKRIRKFQEKVQHYTFIEELTDKEMMLIADNTTIFDLLQADILELEYPFKIDRYGGFFEELSFYNIQDGEQIGELGVGNGTFGVLLATIFDSLSLVMNEIGYTKINYIEDKFLNCKSLRPSNQIYFVRGKGKRTGLDSLNLDKIIIRNSFHHFKHKKEMLTSIKNALKPFGKLYIYTFPKENGHNCPQAMSKESLIEVLAENNFFLMREQLLNVSYLLEFNYVE